MLEKRPFEDSLAIIGDLLEERALLKDLVEDAHFVDTCGSLEQIITGGLSEQRIADIENIIVGEIKHILLDLNNVDKLVILRL
jgi:hypothetical protein